MNFVVKSYLSNLLINLSISGIGRIFIVRTETIKIIVSRGVFTYAIVCERELVSRERGQWNV